MILLFPLSSALDSIHCNRSCVSQQSFTLNVIFVFITFGDVQSSYPQCQILTIPSILESFYRKFLFWETAPFHNAYYIMVPWIEFIYLVLPLRKSNSRYYIPPTWLKMLYTNLLIKHRQNPEKLQSFGKIYRKSAGMLKKIFRTTKLVN